MEEEETLEGYPPRLRAAEAAGEGGASGRRNGKDLQQVVDVAIRQWEVVVGSCLGDYEIEVAQAAHGRKLGVAHARAFSHAVESSPNSVLHSYFWEREREREMDWIEL